MTDERLNSLLDRTAGFVEAVHAHVATLTPAENARAEVAFQAGLLSLEHGTAAFALIEQRFLAICIHADAAAVRMPCSRRMARPRSKRHVGGQARRTPNGSIR
jgi:hypothetical protein